MVLVRVLGPIDVVDGSGAVRAPGSAMRRALLAVLALHVGRVLTNDWLLETVWSGEPPESRLRALRFHISELRKEVGSPALIETVAGGYRLASDADVDVVDVEDRIRNARGEADGRRRAELCGEALALWRGTPFVDAAGCAALDDEAARLTELRLTIIEEQMQAGLDAGAGRELIADLTRAVAEHPLRERFWAMLISAQYRADQQAAALHSYERMRTMLAETLGLEPSDYLKHLQRRVLQHDPSLLGREPDLATRPSTRHRTHRLRALTTALIDSHGQLGIARGLLEDHRLVTLIGPGGVGKTRLAVELGWSMLDQFDAGVWMIELAPVSTVDNVVAAALSGLSIPPQQGMGHLDSIVDWLGGRSILLIFDNCEHVLAGVQPLVSHMLANCPLVTLLATSREPLGLVGEQVHAVRTLEPEQDGIALFLDRAVIADSSFVAVDSERGAIAEICRRVDGLPLAIELAAARVRSLAPVELLSRLDDRFTLLRRGRGGDDRQDTLRATMEWSYRLLSDDERSTFDQLSVFAGSFDLRAVQAICSWPGAGSSSVIDRVSDLVDRSMVVAERHQSGTRYRILESLRELGDEKLRRSGRYAEVRWRHMQHYVTLASEATSLFRSPRQFDGANLFAREWDNLRLAHRTAIDVEAVDVAEQLLNAVQDYAESNNRLEVSSWCDHLIALERPDRPLNSRTFALAAYWSYSVNENSRADELLRRGMDLADGSFDDPARGLLCLSMMAAEDRDAFLLLEDVASRVDLEDNWFALVQLADHAANMHPENQAMHLARLVEVSKRVRVPSLMCETAVELGKAAALADPRDMGEAKTHFGAALEIARSSGDPLGEAEALRGLALAEAAVRDSSAASTCHQALAHLHEIRYWFRIWQVMDAVVLQLVHEATVEQASVVLGHLEAHHPAWGVEDALGFRATALDFVRGNALADDWMALGAAMDRYEIVDYALAALEQ